MTVQCPHCGYKYAVDPGERCMYCGKDMAGKEGPFIICPDCGARNNRTERQCVRCDAELPTAKQSLAQVAPDAFEPSALAYLKRIDDRVAFLYWLAILGIALGVIGFLVSIAVFASRG